MRLLNLVILVVVVTLSGGTMIQSVEARQLTNEEIRAAIESSKLQSFGVILRRLQHTCPELLDAEVVEVAIESNEMTYQITLLTGAHYIVLVEADGATGKILGITRPSRRGSRESYAYSCRGR